ncbi:hypothetical protein PMKS-002739 [Pichia membranifaciens]|uniref:Myosin motor domain-containing protein n=1 Tax=Pichia membranifaciens TaxID=4926 RepID=A0A1Q2YI83_9ASCO|nr:hypothetical protein PMKS-002739 [Pichia membranifaciens]
MENYHGEVWVSKNDQLSDSIFEKGEIVENIEGDDNKFKVKLLNSDRLVEVDAKDLQKSNPSRFDGYDDMASLTYLNEPSVLNNLKIRYQDDKIYTYSGLFLVTVNPYKMINIYNPDFIRIYSKRNESAENENPTSSNSDENESLKPHIFGTAQKAFENLIANRNDQSILVTGESGAGKTENTKKVIQYILSVSTTNDNKDNALVLENQILQANPIMESFGNATTVRNLNSSRFGKFIKIQVNIATKELSGAHIDWYLLEKSRVISQDSKERNYHVFYQLLKGASKKMLDKLLISETSVKDYEYLKNGLTSSVENINDKEDFQELVKAFKVINFSEAEIFNVFKILSIILHLGNIHFKNLSNDTKQAVLSEDSDKVIEETSQLLGIPSQAFRKSFLNSKIKIGKEIVNQQRTATQAKFSIDALSKSLYEKLFQYLIDKINGNFKSSTYSDNVFDENLDNYIGILDIAGFEIFDKNSFEQLCINYTNEKLQQFFNHHMFVLEQSEYMKEGISWKYIDFGNELKPTIELIEGTDADKRKTNIFSILNEECVVPKGTDKSFIEKLFKELEVKDFKIDKTNFPFRANKLRDGFLIKHYAGNVDYSVDGWLNKNKDPLSASMIELLSNSNDTFVSDLFNSGSLEINATDSPLKDSSPRKKTGMFRTVAKRHKEQLTSLMDQLSRTYPHFVRCILPNNEKKPGAFNDKIVLHQLRCNGVLEGIRIARSGYPNRIDFKTFATHYSLLSSISFSGIKNNNSDYKQTCELILDGLDLEPEVYKIGLTKLFFRNGVLAKLEKKREEKLAAIFSKFNSIARGSLVRKNFQLKLQRFRASQVLITNFQRYAENNSDPWFKLIKAFKPRLDDSGMMEIQYSNKIAKLENTIKGLVDQLNEEASDRDSTASKLKALDEELLTHKSVITKKDSELDKSKNRIVNLEKELAEVAQLSEESSCLLKEKEKALETLSQSNVDDVERLRTENEELKASKSKLESKIASELKVIPVLREEIASLKSSIDKKEMELSSLKREKRSKDTESAKKIGDLQVKLNEAIKESRRLKADLETSSNSFETNKSALDNLQSEHSKALEDLSKLQESTKDYEANRLAYEQSEKIKKKFKQLKHEYQQAKSLLDQKVKDEIEFNKGRQQYDKELEETKSLIKGLQSELAVEKRSAVDLELKLQQARLETERAIKDKKSLEMRSAQLKLRLQNINPMQANMNQMEINRKNHELSPEIHQLREEVRLLRTRLASESYENRNLKAILKKGGASLSQLDNFRISGISTDISNESVKIFDDRDETSNLKEKLEVEKEANKRLQDHYVQLQKDLMYYKSKFNNSRDSTNSDSGVLSLLDTDAMEYKSKFQMSQIEVSDLKEQVKDLRILLKKNETSLDRNEKVLNDSTNVENNFVADDKVQTKLKHENLRLSSALNELKTRLNRLEQGNGSRFEQEEEIIQLRGNLKTIQLKNTALTSSVELYKDRSEDYYTKLSKAEVELQSSVRERKRLHDDITHLKEKLRRSELHFEESDKQVQVLSESIRSLEKKISDKDFQIDELTGQYESLKDRLENSEELRRSVKSVSNDYQEAEIERLNQEIVKSLNKETEMSKLLRSLNLQLETSKKEITSVKFNNNELFKEKNVLTKALNDCMSKNEALLTEVKENISKVQNLFQQVSVLKVSNGDLLRERDDLLTSKRSLEYKLNEITIQFDQHLLKVRDDANNEVLAEQLGEKLQKSRENIESLNDSLRDYKTKHSQIAEELNKVKNDYAKTVEENKELTKFNNGLINKLDECERKHTAEIKAQDLHWSKRINELDEKLFMTKSLQRNEAHQFESLNRTIKELEIRNKDLERSKKHSDDEIKHLEATIEKLNLSYDSLNKREMEAQLRCKQLSRECDKVRDIISANRAY